MIEDHEHEWGKPYHSHFGGNYVRACVIDGCKIVDAYWEDDEDD